MIYLGALNVLRKNKGLFAEFGLQGKGLLFDCFFLCAEDAKVFQDLLNDVLEIMGDVNPNDISTTYFFKNKANLVKGEEYQQKRSALRKNIISNLLGDSNCLTDLIDEQKSIAAFNRAIRSSNEVIEALISEAGFFPELELICGEYDEIKHLSTEKVEDLFLMMFSNRIDVPFLFSLIRKVFLIKISLAYLKQAHSKPNGVLNNFIQDLFVFSDQLGTSAQIVSGDLVYPARVWKNKQHEEYRFFFKSRMKSKVSYLLKYTLELLNGADPRILTDTYAVMFVFENAIDLKGFKAKMLEHFKAIENPLVTLEGGQSFRKKIIQAGLSADEADKFIFPNLYDHSCECQLMTFAAFDLYNSGDLSHKQYKKMEYEIIMNTFFYQTM